MDWDLVVIFTFVVIIVAIRTNAKRTAAGVTGLTAGDQMALERAQETARRLEQRVDSLERVLDEDAPGWRARARA